MKYSKFGQIFWFVIFFCILSGKIRLMFLKPDVKGKLLFVNFLGIVVTLQ